MTITCTLSAQLCLMSGEIIQMSNQMSLIFEAMDLSQASVSQPSLLAVVWSELGVFDPTHNESCCVMWIFCSPPPPGSLFDVATGNLWFVMRRYILFRFVNSLFE